MLKRSPLSVWCLLLLAASWWACTPAAPTQDSLVPVVVAHAAEARRGAASMNEEGVRLAIVYSTNNDGEIEPCG